MAREARRKCFKPGYNVNFKKSDTFLCRFQKKSDKYSQIIRKCDNDNWSKLEGKCNVSTYNITILRTSYFFFERPNLLKKYKY